MFVYICKFEMFGSQTQNPKDVTANTMCIAVYIAVIVRPSVPFLHVSYL
jgi:hypothetical protein